MSLRNRLRIVQVVYDTVRLSAPFDGRLTINGCTFDHNGNGSGYTHNLYVGDITKVVITNSTFTNAVVGHEIKSRAETTIIQNCTIIDGPTGTASYSIDLPNGGNALVQNNVIEKGPNAENSSVIHYGGEGVPYAGSQLTVQGNTVTNDLTAHSTVFVLNQTLNTVNIAGNTFLGVPVGNYALGPAKLTANTGPSGEALADTSVVDLAGGGNTIYIKDDQDHSIEFSTPFQAVIGGVGRLTATGWSHETVVGGTGGIVWNGQDGADDIITKAGSANTVHLGHAGNLVQSEGIDTITATTGNDGYVINGQATIEGSTGASGFAVNGSAVIHGHGIDTVSIGANAVAQITDGQYFDLTSNGGTFSFTHQMPNGTADTVTVRGGSATLKAYDASGIHLTMGGGRQGAEIDFGTGNGSVISSAPDTIRAGSGNDTVILSGSAEVFAGTGTLSVFGRGIQGLATIHGGAGTTVIDGDTGNIRFQADGGPATVDARLSRIQVIGGASALTVNANAYSLTVQGGIGGLVFNDHFSGHDITTAAGAKDVLNLNGGSVVHSNGTDRITLGSNANFTIEANGAATIQGGAGDSSFTLNGRDVVVTRSAQIDRVTVGTRADAQVVSQSARDAIWVGGGKLTYAAAENVGGRLLMTAAVVQGWATVDRSARQVASITTVDTGSTRIDTAGAANIDSHGTDTIRAAGAAVTVTTSGTTSVQSGTGGGAERNYGTASVQAGAGSVTLDNEGGAMTFVGGSGNANIQAAGGSVQVHAGSGNTTLVGGGAQLDYVAGSGAAQLQLGSGNSTVHAGAGAMTVNCGWGQEVIEVQAGKAHGNAVVNNFDVTKDRVQLDGYAIGSAQVTTYAGGVQLNLSDGTHIQFAGLASLPGV